MKSLAFALGTAAVLALAGCSVSNEDQVDNSALNETADIDALSNDAANEAAAAEAEALANQQQQLENENTADSATNPVDEDEQNVSGM